jgi:hypothetical protein
LRGKAQEPEDVVLPPESLQPLLARAELRRLLFVQVQRQLAQQRQVLRAVALADPAGVLVERHVQRPMQSIFDAPVPSPMREQRGGGSPVDRRARQRVGTLEAQGAARLDHALDAARLPQPRPADVRVERLGGPGRARLDPPARAVDGRGVGKGGGVLGEESIEVAVQGRVFLFDDEKKVVGHLRQGGQEGGGSNRPPPRRAG